MGHKGIPAAQSPKVPTRPPRTPPPSPVEEHHGLAAALTKVIEHLNRRDRPGVAAACELRSAATPGNGFTNPDVPHEVRPRVAAAMRAVAASGHPEAARLEAMAAELDPAAPAPAAQAPKPAPRPAPAPARVT